MIQQGRSTEQWTPLFFWFLRITTFWGQQIWLSSAIIAFGFFFAVRFFVESLNLASVLKWRSRLLFSITPIYGFWSVTVSHDSTQVIGVLLYTGIFVRLVTRPDEKLNKAFLFSAVLFLLTTWAGYAIFIVGFLYLFRTSVKQTYLALSFGLIIMLVSPFGLDATRYDVQFRPFLVDIKCAVQHKESKVSVKTWQSLEALAPREVWIAPVSCSSMDGAVNSIASSKSFSQNLRWRPIIEAHFQLLRDNPAVVLMGHIQRSTPALPPLLFQPPKNQVNWDLDEPVGLGTNTMLQQGPEVLHPSLDEPSVDVSVFALTILEIPAQLLGFVVNQASWFWGWGGFWILFFFGLLYKLGFRSLNSIKITTPLLIIHGLAFLIGPDPNPRYVLPTLVIGQLSALVLLLMRIQSKKLMSGDLAT